MMQNAVEPWLRQTHRELDALRRQVVHALELAAEDAARWCEPLTEAELNAEPFTLPSVAFQMRHTVRSLDRLLTYAEDHPLSSEQMEALRLEAEPVSREALLAEFAAGLETALARVRCFSPDSYESPRYVGRARIPVTAGALLVHCAEHTQRHAGQMVTTAKLVRAVRERGSA